MFAPNVFPMLLLFKVTKLGCVSRNAVFQGRSARVLDLFERVEDSWPLESLKVGLALLSSLWNVYAIVWVFARLAGAEPFEQRLREYRL